MRHEDPLHAFARDRMAANGGPRSPAEVLQRERDDARRECVKAYRLALGAAALMAVFGVGLAAYGTLTATGPGDPLAAQRSGSVFAGAVIALAGALFGLVARPFNVPWTLEHTGRPARAVVVSVESGASMRRGKRGPIVLTTGEARLAVQVDGAAVYETTARVVFQAHGPLAVGQEIAVRVDPANPRRVLVCAPPLG